MRQGFQDRFCRVITTDFHQFKAVEAKEYVDADGTIYQIPIGAGTDLASVPQVFWNVLPPFGEYALEAFLHDCAYQNTLKKQMPDGSWVLAQLPREECDNLFKRAMTLNPNITKAQRITLYDGVTMFGWHAFRDDRGQ